ncbi:MFS transporter [Spirosoma rhododendri]|uniref:MFS transporter n=1 Tax=Spirosoma rhododendri TaxID=2728024 RepID=A0A7L5DK48_9BACT|nr:MFS transporter [Spirosoma rhododendri]QJD78786.1 MFS transporter [Spirosoma rhododendri]
MIQQTFRLYRRAYTGLSPTVWLLAGVMLINRIGTMVLPYLTLYMTERLHYTVAQAGIVMAVFGSGALIGTFLGGRLTDRFGFYYVQLLSLVFGGLALVGLQFVTNFYALCGSVFLFTLLGDSFRPANQAALTYYATPDTRTRSFSLNRLAINLGWTIGASLGGFLAQLDYRLLFWTDGLTCLLAALILFMRLPIPARQVDSVTHPDTPQLPRLSPYRDRAYLFFALLATLYFMGFMQFFSIVTLYFREVLHLTKSQIGLLMSLNGLLIVLIEVALVYTLEQRFRNRLMLAGMGTLLLGVAYLLMTQSQLAGVALWTVLIITASEMLAMPFMQSFAANRGTPQNRGQYLALYSMAGALAQTTSPALGAQLVAHVGFSANWLLLAGLCGLATAGFWWLGQRETDQPHPETAPVAS